MKAEPDTRIVKGKDVKVSLSPTESARGVKKGELSRADEPFVQFSIDDFEAMGFVHGPSFPYLLFWRVR